MKTSALVASLLTVGFSAWLRAQPTAPAPEASSPTMPPVPIERAHQADYVVLHEVTGPIKTNAYLLYDRASREAALIDVGGAIDSLTSAIETRGLRLKYIFTTHGHVDHVEGMPALRARYPGAKWCMAREEFEDFARYARWEEALPADVVARIKAGMAKDPAMAETFRFNFSRLGAPDEFIGDGRVLHLGDLTIHCLLCRGHSRGSICFLVNDALFSGDVLSYRRIGTTDLPEAGGRPALEASVRRLYATIPDETTVYPGHGHFTEMGIEKAFNEQVRAEPEPQ